MIRWIRERILERVRRRTYTERDLEEIRRRQARVQAQISVYEKAVEAERRSAQ